MVTTGQDVEATRRDFLSAINEYGWNSPTSWKRRLHVTIATLVLIAGQSIVPNHRGAEVAKYVTQEVTRGALNATVTATGNLKPRNQVDISSELSGTIHRVVADVNDTVEAGEELAVLDISRLQAQVLHAQSSLAAAEAREMQSDVGLKEAHARHARLRRLRELSGSKLPSRQELDAAEGDVSRAIGDKAAARAIVAQARANLDRIRADLAKAAIRSPIDGIVLVRSIEPGQTIAASLQAPVLFIVAEDLKRMELRAAVDEADIGAVQVGQNATFTVDAFPNDIFSARVTQIHMASNNTRQYVGATQLGGQQASDAASVVTYETILEVDNSDSRLRPGMTATVEIVTTRIKDATLVPNAAMRFTPESAEFPGMSDDGDRRIGIMLFLPYMQDRWSCPREGGKNLGCVWVLDHGQPALAIFKPGATDRVNTQVLDLERLPGWRSLARLRTDEVLTKAVQRKLQPGMHVIVDAPARTP